MDSHVKVWKNKVGKIDGKIYRYFIELLDRCIYGGIYKKNFSLSDHRGFRKNVLATVKKIKYPTLRRSSGNFASNYHTCNTPTYWAM